MDVKHEHDAPAWHTMSHCIGTLVQYAYTEILHCYCIDVLAVGRDTSLIIDLDGNLLWKASRPQSISTKHPLSDLLL